MVGRAVLVLVGVAVAVVALVLAIQELNEVSEVTPVQEQGGEAGSARTVIVRLKDDEFHPPNVSLRGGQTVRWVNADDAEHTVTSAPSSQAEFDSGRLDPRETFDQSFNEVGVFGYESTIDRGMKGKVTVLGD